MEAEDRRLLYVAAPGPGTIWSFPSSGGRGKASSAFLVKSCPKQSR